MKKLLTKLALTAASLTLVAPVVTAHDHDSREGYGYFDKRSAKQHQRIRVGEQNSRLTPDEVERLYRDQHRLASMERDFRADGHLSYSERQRLDAAYNDASFWIYRLKHNRTVEHDWHGRAQYEHDSREHRETHSPYGRDSHGHTDYGQSPNHPAHHSRDKHQDGYGRSPWDDDNRDRGRMQAERDSHRPYDLERTASGH
jgi:hypothetical protein